MWRGAIVVKDTVILVRSPEYTARRLDWTFSLPLQVEIKSEKPNSLLVEDHEPKGSECRLWGGFPKAGREGIPVRNMPKAEGMFLPFPLMMFYCLQLQNLHQQAGMQNTQRQMKHSRNCSPMQYHVNGLNKGDFYPRIPKKKSVAYATISSEKVRQSKLIPQH